MNLGDGSGRQGHFVERRECFGDRAAVRTLNDVASNRARKGWHAVLQLRQLVRNIRRQQITPRGDCLSELHEDRSKLLQCESEPLAALGPAAALEPNSGREEEKKAQRAIQMRRPDEVVQAVFQQNTLD